MKTTNDKIDLAVIVVREPTAPTVLGDADHCQCLKLQNYCDQYGLQVVRTYRVTSSGLESEGSELDQLLSDISSRQFGTIVCWALDRLSLSTLEVFRIIRVSTLNRVRIISMYPVRPEDDATFELIALMEMSALSRRAQMARTAMAESGRIPVGRLVYGYAIDNDRRAQIREEAAATVRMIFDLYTNKGMGAERIAGLLNAVGIASPGKAGAGWTRSAVLRILRNSSYMGTWFYCVSLNDVQSNAVPPTMSGASKRFISIDIPAIVNQSLWERTQKLRTARRSRKEDSSVSV